MILNKIMCNIKIKEYKFRSLNQKLFKAMMSTGHEWIFEYWNASGNGKH